MKVFRNSSFCASAIARHRYTDAQIKKWFEDAQKKNWHWVSSTLVFDLYERGIKQKDLAKLFGVTETSIRHHRQAVERDLSRRHSPPRGVWVEWTLQDQIEEDDLCSRRK